MPTKEEWQDYRWLPGKMDWPSGGDLNRKMKMQIKAPYREVGSGTLDDPKILWLWDFKTNRKYSTLLGKQDGKNIGIDESWARQFANQWRCPYIWMLAPYHGTGTSKTYTGERAISSAEPHVTFRLGRKPDIVNLTVHLYLTGNQLTQPHERKEPGGHNPEYFTYGRYPASKVPPEAIIPKRSEIPSYSLKWADSRSQSQRKKGNLKPINE
ncbi:hypothetical protein F4779DRAFT_321114 [Xylariaceae sp. FL0662B]|nr:hypothetical protein F4779DRAFT_321114 [Xylariaceae sp. FL0662B]